MQPQPPLESLAQAFLAHLDAEEQLLLTAIEATADLQKSLRSGDMNAIKTARPRHEELAAVLGEAAKKREMAAAGLARSAGLLKPSATLQQLADALGPPYAATLLAARDRLTVLADRLAEYQRRNANLIHYLRSYLRSVLASLTKTADIPVRYGRTGVRLDAAPGITLRARG